jgi:hypothetical protein
MRIQRTARGEGVAARRPHRSSTACPDRSAAACPSSVRSRAGTIGLTLVLLMCCGVLPAEPAGSTQHVRQDVTLTWSGRDVCLDPDPHIGPDNRVIFTDNLALFSTRRPNLNAWAAQLVISLLQENGVPIPDFVEDIIEGLGDIGWVRITPSITLGPAGDVGAYAQVSTIHGADIDVTYPVSLPMTLPAANSFRCGDSIRIETQAMTVDNPTMAITPPYYNLQFGPVIDNVAIVVHIGIRVEACIGLYLPGICLGVPVDWSSPTIDERFPIDLPPGFDNIPPLLDICESAFAPGAGVAELLQCSVAGTPPLFVEAVEHLDEINSRMGYNLSWATFSPGRIDLATPDLPSIPGMPPLPTLNACFDKVPAALLSYQSLDDGRRLVAHGTKTDSATVSFDLVSLTDIISEVLSLGLISTSYSLGGGLGSIDFGTVAPTISLDQDLSFEYRPEVQTTFDLGVPMAWEIHEPTGGPVESGWGRLVPVQPGQSIHLTFPSTQAQTVPVTATYRLAGDMTTSTRQTYYRSVLMEALCLKIGSFFDECLLSDTVQKTMLADRPIEEHTVPVTGSSAQAVPLVLDPETPALDIRSLEVVHVANAGDGERDVVYRLKVANGGDVPLTEVELERDFRETFGSSSDFEITCLHSQDLDVNESFDGDADTDLLAAGNSMNAGQESTIDMVVHLRPEVADVLTDGCFAPVEHEATSSGTAESPLGVEVRDRHDACTGAFTSPEIVSKVDLGATSIAKLDDYTVYGWSGVEMAGSFGLSKGNIGSGDDLKVLPAKPLPVTDLRILGDVHVAGDLLVNGSSLTIDNLQVGGSRKLTGRSPSLQLLGAESVGSDCVAVMPEGVLTLPPVECPGYQAAGESEEDVVDSGVEHALDEDDAVFPAEPRSLRRGARRGHRSSSDAEAEAASDTRCRRDLRLAAGENAAASPGGYRTIELRSDSEVVLASGTYDVGRLRMTGTGATVTFDLSGGPITLNLHGWSISGKDLRFVALNGPTRDIHVAYDGKQKLVLRKTLLQGSWLAPYAAVTLDDGSWLEGSLYAARVRIGPEAGFAGHDFVDPIDVDPACAGVVGAP